jgi:methyl-accepting chemotaxis protein
VLDMNTQIGTAAQEQSAITQEVSKEIANLSSKLQRLVSQFKV